MHSQLQSGKKKTETEEPSQNRAGPKPAGSISLSPLQTMADSSQQVAQLGRYQAMANHGMLTRTAPVQRALSVTDTAPVRTRALAEIGRRLRIPFPDLPGEVILEKAIRIVNAVMEQTGTNFPNAGLLEAAVTAQIDAAVLTESQAVVAMMVETEIRRNLPYMIAGLIPEEVETIVPKLKTRALNGTAGIADATAVRRQAISGTLSLSFHFSIRCTNRIDLTGITDDRFREFLIDKVMGSGPRMPWADLKALSWLENEGWSPAQLAQVQLVNPALTTGNCHGYALHDADEMLASRDLSQVLTWWKEQKHRVVLCANGHQAAHTAKWLGNGICEQTLPGGPIFRCPMTVLMARYDIVYLLPEDLGVLKRDIGDKARYDYFTAGMNYLERVMLYWKSIDKDKKPHPLGKHVNKLDSIIQPTDEHVAAMEALKVRLQHPIMAYERYLKSGGK